MMVVTSPTRRPAMSLDTGRTNRYVPPGPRRCVYPPVSGDKRDGPNLVTSGKNSVTGRTQNKAIFTVLASNQVYLPDYQLSTKKINIMETLNKSSVQFKTNIKCGGCVAAVTPFLNEAVGEGHWQVDTQNPNKLLTVAAARAEAAKKAVEKAGYQAESLT